MEFLGLIPSQQISVHRSSCQPLSDMGSQFRVLYFWRVSYELQIQMLLWFLYGQATQYSFQAAKKIWENWFKVTEKKHRQESTIHNDALFRKPPHSVPESFAWFFFSERINIILFSHHFIIQPFCLTLCFDTHFSNDLRGTTIPCIRFFSFQNDPFSFPKLIWW